jgi:hypothetical protein
MIMVLWAKRRKISERLTGKILPAVIQQLKARTRGLGHLTVVDGGSAAAEIWDTTNTHSRHVVSLLCMNAPVLSDSIPVSLGSMLWL